MSGKYIDGIFNYCDAWCERCPFTQRCRNYAFGRALERRVERQDRENEQFWVAMDKACGDSLSELDKLADSLVSPEMKREDEQELAQFGREFDEQDRKIRAHPLSRLAGDYLAWAHRWLERRRDRVAAELKDAFEVIAWYHMFIQVKFMRALSGLERYEDPDDEDVVDGEGQPIPKDSDGSAKIAIIAVERSISAWTIVRERCEKEQKTAMKMIGLLLRIRGLADRTFPEARRFHRPGFDDVGSRD